LLESYVLHPKRTRLRSARGPVPLPVVAGDSACRTTMFPAPVTHASQAGHVHPAAVPATGAQVRTSLGKISTRYGRRDLVSGVFQQIRGNRRFGVRDTFNLRLAIGHRKQSPNTPGHSVF